MKFLPTFALFAASVWGMVAVAQEAETVEEFTCRIKGVTVTFAFEQRRDGVSEEEQLETLRLDWLEEMKPEGVPHAAYVDMQRIIRDVNRKERSGEYRWSLEPDGDGAILGYTSSAGQITAEQAIRGLARGEYQECKRNGW